MYVKKNRQTYNISTHLPWEVSPSIMKYNKKKTKVIQEMCIVKKVFVLYVVEPLNYKRKNKKEHTQKITHFMRRSRA